MFFSECARHRGRRALPRAPGEGPNANCRRRMGCCIKLRIEPPSVCFIFIMLALCADNQFF